MFQPLGFASIYITRNAFREISHCCRRNKYLWHGVNNRVTDDDDDDDDDDMDAAALATTIFLCYLQHKQQQQ